MNQEREAHRRYLSYLERFVYFGRGGIRKLSAAEFGELEAELVREGLPEQSAAEIRKLLLRD